MSDETKVGIQLLADSMAREKHGVGFYDLDDWQQDKVYYEASLEYFDRTEKGLKSEHAL